MFRLIDVILSLILCVLALPIMFVVAMCILILDGRPIFYTHKRAGYKGRLFTLYKFRTMANNNGILTEGLDRITRLGKILRKTSLDELPELFHVLFGQMSLVGPRPLLPEYLEHYSEEQMRRHDVLPGITGWAQVNGRNAIEWANKFKLDVWYVDNRSILLYLKILMLTVKSLICSKDVNSSAEKTMKKFKGCANE